MFVPFKNSQFVTSFRGPPIHLHSHFQTAESADVDKTERFTDFDARRDHYDNEIWLPAQHKPESGASSKSWY